MLFAHISAINVNLVFLSYTFWPDMGSQRSWSDPKSQNYHPVHYYGCFDTPYVVIARRYGLTVSNSKGWPHCAPLPWIFCLVRPYSKVLAIIGMASFLEHGVDVNVNNSHNALHSPWRNLPKVNFLTFSRYALSKYHRGNLFHWQKGVETKSRISLRGLYNATSVGILRWY